MTMTETDSSWKFGSEALLVEIDKRTFSLSVRHGGEFYRTLAGPEEIVFNTAGGAKSFALADARGREASAYNYADHAGLEIRLSQFPVEGGRDFLLRLFVTVRRGTSELHVRVAADEGAARAKRLSWPGPFAVEKPRSADATVIPYMQGMLLPGDWPDEIELDSPSCNGRGLYMPWWGQCRDGAGYIVIIETPADAGCNFSHPAGGPTQIGVRWDGSLGGLAYPRRMRYEFFDSCDYVKMAKRYRAHAIETGHFVALTEKIARNPKVGRLVGSPVIHTSILYHVQPTSDKYNREDPAANHRLTTFAERARQLRQLRARGLEKAYVHLDGWGVRGYDNLHPDYLPACEEAGGWPGLRALADACAEIGYLLALHDQYRDYYLDAPTFDERHATRDENGEMFVHSVWFGGPQTILCGSLAPDYVKRNWEEIRRHVNVDGAYLDVFSCVIPDECYHPEHPMTRAECMRYWGRCFDYIRSLGGVVSSEETTDYAQPHLDLVHHSPYPSQPLFTDEEKGPAGLCVPLWSLVYNDAVLVPWHLGGPAGKCENCSPLWFPWPGSPAATAHAALNGGMPYLDIGADDEELALVRRLCELHDKVATSEMTRHEFLDDEMRRQRATFADGTTVEVDMAEGTFEWK